jgi:hypothetical protein
VHNNISGISNSHINEEVVQVVNGFKPAFSNENGNLTKQYDTKPSFKIKKSKKNKGKKRVLKRVYHESINDQSGYSSLMSSYVDMSGNDIDMSLSRIPEDLDDNDSDKDQNENISQPEPVIMEVKEPDVETRKRRPTQSNEPSEPSMPADENIDSDNDLTMKKNSPRQSITVFNQDSPKSSHDSSEPDDHSNESDDSDEHSDELKKSDRSDSHESQENSESQDSESR